MKRILILLSLLVCQLAVFAQNEGRVGVFAGVNNTTLSNAADAAYGDYLPTFKPTLGLEAGYFFTLFKHLPTGFSLQFFNQKLGQNYRGNYADSTSYYAYSRLNYLKAGLAWHLGTNPRRMVAFSFSAGANIGVLTNYQERYELIRYNNDRLIVDIHNTDVSWDDTVVVKGTLTAPLYNKTDVSAFGTMGLDFLLSRDWVFGVYGRVDMGFSPVENTAKMNINFETQPSSSIPYKPFNTKVKYHGPTDDNIHHGDTKNMAYGVYMSLRYRIFNREKSDFYYRENDKYNH
ncbi:MAG: hypothetical protein RIQ62_816 [Bacteroidota bacterium]|jgi:hypothetical protein